MPSFKRYRTATGTFTTEDDARRSLINTNDPVEVFDVQVDMVLTEWLPDGTQPMRLGSAIFCY